MPSDKWRVVTIETLLAMRDRTRDILSVCLVLAGFAVFAGAYSYTRRQPEPLPPPPTVPLDAAQDVPVEVGRLFSAAVFPADLGGRTPGETDVLALFYLPSEACAPCLNEVQEYASLIVQLNLHGADILPLVLVFEAEPSRALHFIRTAGLSVVAGYGHPEELTEILAGPEGGPLAQQLAFIDVTRGRLFYRILVPNTITPIEEKQQRLERAVGFMVQAWPLDTSTDTEGEKP